MRSRTSIATSISAAKERGCQPSFRGIFHSLTCQLSSLPREELNHCNYIATRERPPHQQTRPRTGYIFFYLADRPKSPQPRATICFLTLAKLCHAFIRRTFKALWDANSTPVCWGCQEGIPIYCISVLASGMPPPSPVFSTGTHFRSAAGKSLHGTMELCHLHLQWFPGQVAAQTSDASHAFISARVELRRFRSEMGKFRRFSRGFSTAGPMVT